MNKIVFQKAQENPLKVLIGLPTRDEFKGDTALSLAFMVYTMASKPVVMVDGAPRFLMWQIQKVVTSNISQSRQNLVDAALGNKCDFLLFLDDDMVFDAELLHDWLHENRPVIAANCPTRSIPCYPTARQPSSKHPFKGELVYSDVARMRWERVWRVGTGIMLLRADALRALPRPAFTIRWEEGNDAYVGEDWVMCEHLERAGIPITVDHELSLPVGHIGSMEFKHEMIAATRQKIVSQSGTIVDSASVHSSSPGIIVP